MNRERNIILAAFLAVLLPACTVQANPGITVNCYDVLNFKAGTTQQRVNFCNTNPSCYMKLTLIQGGRVLWTSGLIGPGGRVTEISLAHALSAGTYRAALKHEFFSLKDKSALNGLNVSLKLKVE